MNRQAVRSSLEWGEVKSLLDVLSHSSRGERRETHVSFLGGEPFLWPHLVKAADYARRCDLTVGVTTNGTGLKGQNLGNLALFDEVTISIEGTQAANEKMRGSSRSEYKRLLDSIIEARRDMEIKLRVAMILSRVTAIDFPAFCEELREIGVDEVVVNVLWGDIRSSWFRDMSLSPIDLRAFTDQFMRLRQSMRGAIDLRGDVAYWERMARYVEGVAVPVQDCNAGLWYLFVGAKGGVAPCAYTLEDFGVNIGTLSSVGDLRAIREGFRRRKRLEMFAACWDCPATHPFSKFDG